MNAQTHLKNTKIKIDEINSQIDDCIKQFMEDLLDEDEFLEEMVYLKARMNKLG